jgi:hypothetical protein
MSKIEIRKPIPIAMYSDCDSSFHEPLTCAHSLPDDRIIHSLIKTKAPLVTDCTILTCRLFVQPTFCALYVFMYALLNLPHLKQYRLLVIWLVFGVLAADGAAELRQSGLSWSKLASRTSIPVRLLRARLSGRIDSFRFWFRQLVCAKPRPASTAEGLLVWESDAFPVIPATVAALY